MLSRRTYGFLFYDAGYYLRKADEQLGISESDAFKSGYGLGISLETGLGILAVSFALADGDSFSDGKIHFGIINEF
jgi:outer membrane protein insertion porin family